MYRYALMLLLSTSLLVPSFTASAADKATNAPAAGEMAPDFTLMDLRGTAHKLSDFRKGDSPKMVVIEWVNPECPFVVQGHQGGSLEGYGNALQKRGVVFLAINSGAKGKQGASPEKNKAGKARFKIEYPILLDTSGKVGKDYGASRTPEMIVIDTKGKIVYRGAIDNTRGGDKEDVKTLVNYVDEALKATQAGKAVSTPFVKPFGCSVKY